ncbi:glycosyltransferase [Gordonia sp. YY1]|uniref:glycosyltransferase n=1 Tax=Gordonia sp. YY1 TaxID=396712 RepID=UPI001331166B|nr:glycosyltransferase [Gordonia sp. YY1]
MNDYLAEDGEKVNEKVLMVVPTMGSRMSWLNDCIKSIEGQSLKPRIIVVGPSASSLPEYCSARGIEFLPDPGKGLSGAINHGWSKASKDTEYLAWLGDDDLLAPGSLSQVVSAMEKSADSAFAYGKTRYIDEVGRTIYISRPTKFAPKYMKFGKDLLPQPGSVARASAITWSPPIDESLTNAMDLDFYLRLSTAEGWTWSYVPIEVSAYRIHGGAITQEKGVRDESEVVRDRYRSLRSASVARRLYGVRNFVERALTWVQWHVPNRKSVTDSGAYCLPGWFDDFEVR